MRLGFLCGVLILHAALLAGEPPAPPTGVWNAFNGFSRPESAYYDAASGSLFVSSIAGDSSTKDGTGWISKLSLDGKIIAEKWVDGLNAPKGLRSSGSTLWVSDLDELIGIDIATAKIKQRVKIEGAKFLNDVAAHPDGTIFVSDTRESKIFTYKDGNVSVFAAGEDVLESPNGILVDADNNRLLVAGRGLPVDGKPPKPAHLFQLDLKTKEKKLITPEPLGNLDGLELDGQGGYIVSDWIAGRIFHVYPDGRSETIVKFNQGGADLCYLPEQGLLIIPVMPEGVVSCFSYRPPGKSALPDVNKKGPD